MESMDFSATATEQEGSVPSLPAPRKKKSVQERREHIIAFLFILPPIIGFLVFTALSVIFTFVYSFQDYNSLSGVSSFVEFENYIELYGAPQCIGMCATNYER